MKLDSTAVSGPVTATSHFPVLSFGASPIRCVVAFRADGTIGDA